MTMPRLKVCNKLGPMTLLHLQIQREGEICWEGDIRDGEFHSFKCEADQEFLLNLTAIGGLSREYSFKICEGSDIAFFCRSDGLYKGSYYAELGTCKYHDW